MHYLSNQNFTDHLATERNKMSNIDRVAGDHSQQLEGANPSLAAWEAVIGTARAIRVNAMPRSLRDGGLSSRNVCVRRHIKSSDGFVGIDRDERQLPAIVHAEIHTIYEVSNGY